MAIIKCKMCGGDLVLVEGQSVAECEYCGSKQTVPVADNEKKLTLFARAGRLRTACEFDKAAGIYEAIVADFPEEAEAYWGLILCKYGIEYVDDPTTGKKIPTCHRSSFDSIMEDSDFEQALENADSVARRVYREEAKQIEDIRKGIIAVSANEQPYDIFICYKETDENGDRTLDSVLAQDIYDALSEKGYRTFFARISLEDKLGQEYEPYIFAALNSAKIMLAVGTDYEFYNAVWVKNEWSRFLKLMTKDKAKHLIPCFKGIDAYDMPREFAKLQAQDLGKVGAMQDLLRGIEKILPKQMNTNVIQEKVVVGTAGGNNKVTALLERGNMALEDGDWAKADSFFEDVLNNDAHNAQAYIGKTLAQEKCRTMDALVCKRRDVYQNVRTEELEIPERTAYISGMVEKFALPGYLEAGYLRTLYDVDRTYDSEVAGRKQQYQDEREWWANHKLLSRAEKFATGSVADTLQREKKHLFSQLNDQIRQAEQADAKNIAEMEQEYDAVLAETDAQTEKLHQDAIIRREEDYQNWLEQAKTETEPAALLEMADAFTSLGSYKDSKNLAEHCRKRAEEEQDKLDEAEARRRIQAEQRRKAQQKIIKNIVVAATTVLALAAVASIVVTKVIIPGNAYKEAEMLLNNGQYKEAISAFEALGEFRDSTQRIEECELAILKKQYNSAVALLNEEKYGEAIAAFKALGTYEDSAQRAKEAADQKAAIHYAIAEEQLKNGDTVHAAMSFGEAAGYKDSREKSFALWDKIAVRETLCASDRFTIGLNSNGTVMAVGDPSFGRCNVDAWRNIIAISTGDNHTVGLKNNGTVVVAGDSGKEAQNWKDIVAISQGYYHTVGLRINGTVVSTGFEDDVSSWTDIVAVSAGDDYTIGLRSDGTVVASGNNDYGQCDVNGWTDIVAISTGSGRHTVALRNDGTVVATGYNKHGECEVNSWTDIVAISAGRDHTVGLRSDGKVVATTYIETSTIFNFYEGQCNVSSWRDIIAISAGGDHTVALKSNGEVVSVGGNVMGQRALGNWNNIMLPASSDKQIESIAAAKQEQTEKISDE